MGMAASQARLLCITARIHDVELQAQSIQNAKLQLSTQSDQVYNEYLQALDDTTLTVKSYDTRTGEESNVNATFNNLCSRNKVYTGANNYAIRNSEGLLLVEDKIEEIYYEATEAGKNNAHDFALYFMFGPLEEGDPEPEIEDKKLYNYLISIFNQIQASGGCISIDEYNGPSGDAANNSDWLLNMIKSGQFSINIIETDEEDQTVKFNPTSPSADTYLSETTTTEIDKTALAKAEAEYEHKMKSINNKDKKFDLDLSKLETERNALTTEYDSVKKVVEDNIKRTFGIFS